MTELQGRTAIVTGAASGIGEAVAERLRAEGARVAGLDLAAPSHPDDVAVDLRDTPALAQALARLRACMGPATILVHAAAATHHGGLLDTDPATYADLYDVNAIGAVRLLQALVPDMRAAGGGAAVLFSSINARFATPTLAAYAMTKAAIENLVQTAALELAGDKIRVNAIAPASVDTPAMRDSYARQGNATQARARNITRHPLARLGTAAEVAELTFFLVSDRAGWITGGVLPIDGGASVVRR